MTNASKRTVAVVGGGAGGLCAAVAAAESGAEVTIYERGSRVGKKLLKTGNGRCNLSNLHLSAAGYNRPDFVAPVLSETDVPALLSFFRELGLWTAADSEGRVYPRSDTASSVLDVLRLACTRLGVRERCSCEVTAAERTRDGFLLRLPEGETAFAHSVILSAGGGTCLAAVLGHGMVPFAPALCPLRTDTAPIRGLSGLRARCRARLLEGERKVAEESGEVLFRDYGVSGIVILDLSRFAEPGQILSLDLLPEWGEEELAAALRARCLTGEESFTGILHRRLGEAVLASTRSHSPEALARAVKDLRLEVKGCADASNAQVIRGGARVEEFDPATLQSRLCPGLYVVGEALDIDGRCGGYNLHWAFASGLHAGRSAAHG